MPAGHVWPMEGRSQPLDSQLTISLQDGLALSPYSHSSPMRGQAAPSDGGLDGHCAVPPSLPPPLLELLEPPELLPELPPELLPELPPELLPELPSELLPEPPSPSKLPWNVAPPHAHTPHARHCGDHDAEPVSRTHDRPLLSQQ